MMASSNLSDMMNWKAVCILTLALASFRSMVGNPVLVPASFLVDCSYWDRGLDDEN